MAASMKVARFLKITTYVANNACKRHMSRAPSWVTGFPNLKDPSAKESNPWDEKNLEERLEELYPKDPTDEIHPDIGVRYKGQTKGDRKELLAITRKNKHNPELEKAARHQTLQVPLEEVEAAWQNELGVQHQYAIAKHYGIYDHLFHGAFFMPVVNLGVFYDHDEEHVNPVYRGNKLKPAETSQSPQVVYDAEEGSLWTLTLSNPDGHLTCTDKEYLHWMIGNIPGSDISSGELLCDYLQPFPVEGTGLHRMVFVLYKQDGQIDYSKEKRTTKCKNLEERTFESGMFFGEHGERLTPMGLSFFQTEWDASVRDVFHGTLDMSEPAYEFHHPPPYHPPQAKYPRKQPFDRYYDRYRDKKDIAEEVLRQKLAMISPFKPHPERPKYPLIHREQGYKPSWLKNREELMHRRLEQFKDLP